MRVTHVLGYRRTCSLDRKCPSNSGSAVRLGRRSRVQGEVRMILWSTAYCSVAASGVQTLRIVSWLRP